MTKKSKIPPQASRTTTNSTDNEASELREQVENEIELIDEKQQELDEELDTLLKSHGVHTDGDDIVMD
jgi:hypothetical protein